MKKIKWGILGTAIIAREQMIPAILQSRYGELYAIASRTEEKAKESAEKFGIPRFYGNYDALLKDPMVEAVYIPLPNHLHVDWAVRALQAGKHVLVEKPVALHATEAGKLLAEAEKHPELKVMEAYMYGFHPQWLKVEELLQAGEIGKLKIIQASFSFYDDDPGSVYNISEYGGGSVMDVGCYPVSVARRLFGSEPRTVTASMEFHPRFDVDIHASGVMEFDERTAIFFSSIQLTEHQEVVLFGSEGKMRIEIPFNPPADSPARVMIEKESGIQMVTAGPCNQYAAQIDAFCRAILEDTPVPLSPEDSVNNMKVIDAIRESGRSRKKVYL